MQEVKLGGGAHPNIVLCETYSETSEAVPVKVQTYQELKQCKKQLNTLDYFYIHCKGG